MPDFVHRKQKSRRGATPEGVRPRRLTLQRTPRQGRVVLRLVIRRLLIVRHGMENAIGRHNPGEIGGYDRVTLRVMVAFRRVGWVSGSPGSAAGFAGQSHCSQSTSASIARRMGAGSIGQTATIRARSAAKTPTSATAPEFAAPWSKKPIFPAFSRGVLVLSSPLMIFAGVGKSSQALA